VVLARLWALGHCRSSAVLVLACDGGLRRHYSAWALLDSGVLDAARFALLASTVEVGGIDESADEIWFSWAIAERAWPLLRHAAAMARRGLKRDHFLRIAERALNPLPQFGQFEQEYDYGG
jgi:hypothetical protein